jgi:hypothetical protein
MRCTVKVKLKQPQKPVISGARLKYRAQRVEFC